MVAEKFNELIRVVDSAPQPTSYWPLWLPRTNQLPSIGAALKWSNRSGLMCLLRIGRGKMVEAVALEDAPTVPTGCLPPKFQGALCPAI